MLSAEGLTSTALSWLSTMTYPPMKRIMSTALVELREQIKTGKALLWVNPDDQHRFMRIEKLIEKVVPKLEIPERLGKGPEYNGARDRSRGPGGGGNRKGGGGNRKGGQGGKSGGNYRVEVEELEAKARAAVTTGPILQSPIDESRAVQRLNGRKSLTVKRITSCEKMARSGRSARRIVTPSPTARTLAKAVDQCCLMRRLSLMRVADGPVLMQPRSPIESRRYWINLTVWSALKCAALRAIVTWAICSQMGQRLRETASASMGICLNHSNVIAKP